MADEPQTPEEAAEPQEAPAEASGATPDAPAATDVPTSAQESETPAEPHAVPTAEATEIAGSTEDAALEAYEESRDDAPHGTPAADTPSAEVSESVTGPVAAEPAAGEAAAESQPTAEEEPDEDEDDDEPAPRVKPAVPGAHLEVDIVPEGVDPLARDAVEDPYAIEEDASEEQAEAEEDQALPEPISTAAIDLAAGARYRATGKRKTAIARVILRPGSGTYKINGRELDAYFPRATLQRNIRQPLETVGYEERMDVVARLHGGGVSAQAGALRHGISRALLEADPNLRGELKRRGFLTRDSRAKERKKAGLKKARKRPQFSKR